MAKFSKEWCEIWDPERIPDFSIEEVMKDVLPDRYYPVVCYGLGFVNIHRDRYDILWVCTPLEDSNKIHWIRLNTLLVRERNKKKLIDETSSLQ